MPAPDLPSSEPIKEQFAFPFPQFRRERLNRLSPCPRRHRGILQSLWLQGRKSNADVVAAAGVSAVILIIQIWTYLLKPIG